jgi:hypothetical protein
LLILILSITSFSTAALSATAESKTIIVPNDYPTINAAISQASDGDTILIRNGKYSEQSLVINKSLTIKSEFINGAEITLHRQSPGHPERKRHARSSIRIYADDVEVSGCTTRRRRYYSG